MTYVFNNLFGNFKKYKEILKELHITNKDTVIILGNLFDKGPDGFLILEDIIKKPYIKLLLNTPEKLILETLKKERTEYANRIYTNLINSQYINYLPELEYMEPEKKDIIFNYLNECKENLTIETKQEKFFITTNAFNENIPYRQILISNSTKDAFKTEELINVNCPYKTVIVRLEDKKVAYKN